MSFATRKDETSYINIMKIFYLTECNPNDNSGGAIIRRGTICFLRKTGLEVIVVKPGAIFRKEDEHTFTIPGFSTNGFFYGLEALGVVSDKHIVWSNNVVRYMRNIIKPNDIIFATTGGALSSIIAGVKLKKITKAKLIVNYHDPTDFTSLGNGFSRCSRFYHINRDRFEDRLIPHIDYVITSSQAYKNVLVKKYPYLASHIDCNYFGYIDESPIVKNTTSIRKMTYNIVYGGNMGPTQSPEILAEAVEGIKGVTATFIGNCKENKSLMKYMDCENIIEVDTLSMKNYFLYLHNNADIGFFSLRNNLANYCVPSKFYDYINVGLPMIAVVKGDAAKLIKDNNYGLVCEDKVSSLRDTIVKMCNYEILNQYQGRILNDRKSWSMSYRIKDVIDIIVRIKND